MMTMLLSWPQAHDAGPAQVGGKAWNLSRLSRYGFAVPEGGALTVAAWRAFAAHNRIDAATATPEQVTAGEMPPGLAADIADGLDRLGLGGAALAVRSSAVAEDGATASFAGIHESVVNVMGDAAVLAAVRACWASAFSERARAYRQRMGLDGDDIAPAVILQRLVVPVAAGVAFTLDPASGRQDRVMVAANRGLGETVVAGTAEPDQYLVDCGFHAATLAVLSRQPGRKQSRVVPNPNGGTMVEAGADGGLCLDDARVLEIARLALRVRWALGHDEVDQDVEWVWDGRRVLLVQARPVTARPRWTYPALRAQPEVWSNGNLRDSMPMVMTPMTWSLSAAPLHSLLPVQHLSGGAKPMPGISRMRPIDGRAYLDISVMQWECWDNFGIRPDVFNNLIGGHQPAIAVPPVSWRRRLARLRINLRLGRAMKDARRHADAEFAHLQAMVDEMRAQDVAGMTDGALMGRLMQFIGSDNSSIPRVALLLMGSGFTLYLLRPLLERFLPGRGDAVAHALLGDSAAITSAEHGRALAGLARAAVAEDTDPATWASLPAASPFRQAMQDFLDRWGHRAVYELELANPRWREDQEWLVETIRTLMAAPPAPSGRGAILAAQAWAEVERAVPRPLRSVIRRMAGQAGREAAQREEAKSAFVRIYEPMRMAVLEIGRRLAARGTLARRDDVFLLTWEEMDLLLTGQWSSEGARALVADRAQRADHLSRQPAADVVVIEGDRRRHETAAAGSGPELTGCAAASGLARGHARVILHPHDGHRLQPGDILVAPSTDPAWTPLFLRAAAVVMETGGLLSHGAIVAREYGLPAVVNVQGALTRLRDGMALLVDGDRGVVRIEDGEGAAPHET